jgi:hypothetical protein
MEIGVELISDNRRCRGKEEGMLCENFKFINFGEAKKKGLSYGIKKEENSEGIRLGGRLPGE